MKQTKRPHILIFNPDQFRADALGHLGYPAAATPHLDRLARTDGVSFSHAFCQNPVCTPSRCSFMSGWYPHVAGHRTMFHMMHAHEPVLLKTLKDNGYTVWWGGKNDLVPGQDGYGAFCDVKHKPNPTAPDMHGWQDWRGEREGDNWFSFHAGKLTDVVPWTEPGQDGAQAALPSAPAMYRPDSDWEYVRGAIEYIRKAPVEEPLCLYLPLLYPHPPYGVEDPWFSGIDRGKVPFPIPEPDTWEGKPSLLRGIRDRQRLQGWTPERFRELRATYDGMCSRIDNQFGLLMEALRERGIYDETAVFVFSDHGDFTGNYGLVEKTQNTFEDCLTRVPFLIKPPAGVPVVPGVRDQLVELVDFPATVEALCGLTPAHTHFGKSLLPVLADPTQAHRDAVFCEGGRIHGEAHCMEHGIENPDNLYWPRVGLQQSEGPEHTKAVMVRTDTHKYVRRLYESDELYDLVADPGERHNRIADPALRETLLLLKERMLTFFLETGDAVPHQPDQRG
jgi:arylsulfatase A-like enzyme